MKGNFNAALAFVMEHECVFAPGHFGEFDHVICENVTGDRGGLTKFGIDQRSHPNIDIKHLDYHGAARLYRDIEWTKCRCDELPSDVDVAVFDTAVNCGCGTAARLLQEGCNQAGADPSLSVDGFIGPKTIAASFKHPDAVYRLLTLRELHYQDLADDNPRLQKFMAGWMNRLSDLQIAVNGFHLMTKPEAANQLPV